MKKQELKYYKYKLKLGVGNFFAALIMIILLSLLYFTFDDYYFNFEYKKILIMIGYFILHEILHYIGYLINKNVKNKDLCLGMCLEKGVMYCRCTNEISRTAVMISLLTPFTVIGIITLIISYIFDMPFLAFLSVSNIAGSYFDILMFVQMLKMPKDIKFAEYDECDAYYIISNKDLTNIKTKGISLVKTDKFNKDKLKSKDNKKIEISVFSIIILIVLVALYFII